MVEGQEECPHPEWLGVWANTQGVTLKIRWGSNGEKMGWLLEQYGLEIYTRNFEGPYCGYKKIESDPLEFSAITPKHRML